MIDGMTETVLARLERLCREKGLSEREACERADVNHSIITALRKRTAILPLATVRADTAAALARVLGRTTEYILHGRDDIQPESEREKATTAAMMLGHSDQAIRAIIMLPHDGSRSALAWFRLIEAEEAVPGATAAAKRAGSTPAASVPSRPRKRGGRR